MLAINFNNPNTGLISKNLLISLNYELEQFKIYFFDKKKENEEN